MTLRSDLIAARALIDTPEKWCKGYMRDDAGRFCAVGACAEIDGGIRTIMALHETRKTNGWMLSAFNDAPTTTHADIMSLFQRAIDNAGEME